MTAITADLRAAATAQTDRRKWLTFAVLGGVLVYLAYAWVAFGVTELIEKARPDRAGIILSDMVSYKVHITHQIRRNTTAIAIEGDRSNTYTTPPDWITVEGSRYDIDLGDGYRVVMDGNTASFDLPGIGVITAEASRSGVATTLPDGDLPAWISVAPRKIDIRAPAGRLQVSTAKIEVHRRFWGWEAFFFPIASPLYDKSFTEIAALAVSSDRIDPAQSNIALIGETFWNNPTWHHGKVITAVFETIMMAFLGTFGAAILALPLAFMAAANFNRSMIIRFFVRRFSDFQRGVDNLIYSILLSRAFGPGPLTGALAMMMTDIGTFIKLFSEAMENIDDRQVEGVQSTGAGAVQRYRFAVIPQLMPVLLSQVLYYLESNTRSATVVGAIVGGGIGLLLTQAIRTYQDWEDVTYYTLLIVVMVIAMDSFSGWLRRKLIGGDR